MQALRLKTALLQLALAALAFGIAHGVLGVQLLLEDLVHDELTGHTEYAVGDPVDTHGAGHDKADPDAHQRHHQIHALHGGLLLLIRRGRGVGGRGDLHAQIAETGGDKGDQEQPDRGPGVGTLEQDPPVGRIAEIQAEKAKVDVEQTRDLVAKRGLNCVPVLVRELCQLDLDITGAAAGGLHGKVFAQRGDNVGAREHHARDRLADDAVQGDQDREGDQRPQAAGHRVDALLAVELLHLGVELLGVALMLFLQLLDARLQAGGTHHALFALGVERREDQVHDQGKEDDSPAIAAGQVIEPDHQLGKGPGDDFTKRHNYSSFSLWRTPAALQGTGS